MCIVGLDIPQPILLANLSENGKNQDKIELTKVLKSELKNKFKFSKSQTSFHNNYL